MVAAAKLSGLRFGTLVVLERAESSPSGKTKWVCSCDCGDTAVVFGGALTSGHTRSCGCVQKESLGNARRTHGATSGLKRTKAYRSWLQIRRRCVKGDVKAFERYGAVGIKMALEWQDDFAAFLAHIGQAPSEKHSVDRIKNERGYEPGNVRWATQSEQCRNKQKNLYVDVNGKKTLLVEACEQTGMNYFKAYQRLRRGREPFHV